MAFFFSTDADLLLYHANILSYGIQCWDAQHDLAALDLIRDLDVLWYRTVCVNWEEKSFDETLLLNLPKFNRVACFKTLEYIFDFLSKDPDDYFREFSKIFAKKYETEFNFLLKAGIDYDFAASGAVTVTDKKIINCLALKRA